MTFISLIDDFHVFDNVALKFFLSEAFIAYLYVSLSLSMSQDIEAVKLN